MKRIIIAACALLLLPGLLSCNESGGDSTDYGFSIYPGRVFYGVGSNAAKAHDISFGGFTSCGPSATCYAIIYTGVLNGTSYVGIAAEQETATEVNSMKIWFPGTLTAGTHNVSPGAGGNVKAIRKYKATGVTEIRTLIGAFNVIIGAPTGNIYPVSSTMANLTAGGSLLISSMSALRVQ